MLTKRQLYPKEAFLFKFNWFKISVLFFWWLHSCLLGKLPQQNTYCVCTWVLLFSLANTLHTAPGYIFASETGTTLKELFCTPKERLSWLARVTLVYKIAFWNSPRDSRWLLEPPCLWIPAEHTVLGKQSWQTVVPAPFSFLDFRCRGGRMR